MTLDDIRLDEAALPETFEGMFRALERETIQVVGPMEFHVLSLPLRDADGSVTGGLWGTTLYRWLSIQLLVVPDALRNCGVGSALVARAEQEAARRGCRGALVDTFDFQAEGFYRRLGYVRFGVLDDFPPGHRRIYMSKKLATA